MKKTFRLSITCARAITFASALFLVGILASPSLAADDRGFYVQYNAGAVHVPNQNLTNADASGVSNTTGQKFSGHTDQNPGFAVGGAIGARFLEHFRAEVEYMYRESEVTSFSIQTGPSSADGDVDMSTIMANVYAEYDFEIGILPYVGIGIGWGSLHLNAKNREVPELSRIDGRDSVFVYSVMAGGSYPVNEMVDLTFGYRYLRTTDSEMKNSLSVPSVTPTARRARRLDYEYDAHEGVVGLRFNF